MSVLVVLISSLVLSPVDALLCSLSELQHVLGSFSDLCSAKFGSALSLVATLGDITHSLNKTVDSLISSVNFLEVRS